MKTISGVWNGSADAVTLIDAHHHLWDLSQRKHPNLIGEPRHDFFMGDDAGLRRDYLPARRQHRPLASSGASMAS